MQWTEKDTEHLRMFRKTLDSDDIKLKEEIKARLLKNKYIVHVINNKELEENDAEPVDYFGVNILPYYLIPDAQSSAKCFICYEVSNEPRSRWDTITVEKYQRITFYILCHQSIAIEKHTSLARHDLLAALIMEEFNSKVLSCGRILCISDLPSVTDNNFLSRTLIYQSKTDNNIMKTVNGIPKIINKSVIDNY